MNALVACPCPKEEYPFPSDLPALPSPATFITNFRNAHRSDDTFWEKQSEDAKYTSFEESM